jgi:DNA-binding response OmpR family regulator
MSVKILIIDDDISIGNLEQQVLEQTGYQVLRAYSGTEAELLLKSCRPDLILLDLMLPGLSIVSLLILIFFFLVMIFIKHTGDLNTRASH